MLKAYLSASPQGEVADVAMAHLAVAHLGLGQLDDAWKIVAELAERFPRTKILGPTRLRLAEAELAAHRADRACEQFRIVAGVDRSNGELPAASDAGKSNDSAEQSLRIRALAGLGKSLWELGKPAEAATAFATVTRVGHRTIQSLPRSHWRMVAHSRPASSQMRPRRPIPLS